MRRSFKRALSSLKLVFQFIDEFEKAADVPEAFMFPMRFAAEEVFTNMVKYNAEGPGDIELAFQKNGDRLSLELIDQTALPFDITQFPEVDVTRPIEELQPGGLGIHLTKKLMDEISYSFESGRSHTTLVKYLRKT